MQFVFIIHLISLMLIFVMVHRVLSETCDIAHWERSLDRNPGWSVCPRNNTYLKGFWRSPRKTGDERVGRLERGKCCDAAEPRYAGQPSRCVNANWSRTLDGHNIWALCPKGFYMNGIRTGSHLPFLSFLNHIDEARCCHPTDHPSSYEDCYDEDVAISFNNEGWSECQKNGYYMSGLYKSNCDELNCIDKFRCCKHLPKNGQSNGITDLQKEEYKSWVDAIITGSYPSTHVSTVITKFLNLTKTGNELKLNLSELSLSVDMLKQLVQYNSIKNNSAIGATSDQQNIVRVASNLLDEENTKTWLLLQEKRGNITDILLKTMDDFAFQVNSNLGNSTNKSELLSRNIALRVDRWNPKHELKVDFAQYGATILVPGSAISDTVETCMSTIAYRTLENVLRLPVDGPSNNQSAGGRLRRSGTSIVSFTIHDRVSGSLNKPIKLAFNHNNKRSDLIGQCVFWEIDQSQRTWLTRGCVRVDRESNPRVTTCECDHLTIFAVLLNNKPVKSRHQPYFKYISTVGCACSLFFLVLTCVTILACWKKLRSFRITMLLHLFAAISVSCLLIIIAGKAERPKELCTTAAVLLHYSLLSVFFWMLCHGVMLYFLILKAERQEILALKKKWFYALGWGVPVLIVAISLAVTGIKSYAANNCWLTTEHWLIYWAFVAPVAVILLINSILLIFLLRRIHRATKTKNNKTSAKHVKDWLRRFAMLLPVLGVTWSFGFLTFITSTTVFHYIFAILNSFQGLFIFVSFCILDDSVKKSIKSILCEKMNTTKRDTREGNTVFQE
nr:adhesion G protein-coupled receptor L3-like [Pocillopora verrucosa]